jgi:predicted nucleic acid-binding protein
MKIFIDTSALIAYYNIDDLHHAEASEVFNKIEKGEISLTRFFTTDYILDETVTFIECMLNRHELAVSVGQGLLTSPFTTLLRIDEEFFQEAWNHFGDSRGHSFTDCTSFTVMRKFGITHAFTFDRHFGEAGFQTIP